MFPSLLSSKPFPLQPLLAALSSPPPLSRPLSRFSACSQICFWLSASAPPLQPLCLLSNLCWLSASAPPLQPLCPLLNLCWLSALAPPFYRPAPLAASLLAPKFVLAQRFSAPFSAFFAFALLPPLLPHPSSLAFLGFSVAIILVPAKALASGPLSRFCLLFFLFQGFSPHLSSFSLAIILVPAKALASGPLSRFRRFSCYHSYRSYRSYHSYRGCKRRGRGCAKITSGEHHCPPEASR